jgi:dynein heavy chain
LSELIQDDVLEKKDQMEEISGRASGEAGIESQVDEIKKKWSELAFTVSNYREQKDKFIIGGVDDIIAALDDHQLKVQTMLGTRFVAEIRPQVEQWERMLVLISDIIDEWLTCQR